MRPAPLLYGFAFLVFAFLFAVISTPLAAQLDPVRTINEDCTALSFGPDGRIVYAVRRVIRVRKIEMERDDIWVTSVHGGNKRIVEGEKLFPKNAPISYGIQGLHWSPDGSRLTVDMLVRQMTDEEGGIKEDLVTMLLDDDGKDIRIANNGNTIPDATQGAWLGDGATLAYLSEAVKPGLLFGVHTFRPAAGRGDRLFEGHAFAAVAWDAKRQMAAGVERDTNFSGPFRLVWLDLQKQTRRELAALSGYVGSLTISPSGTKVAYFTDPETLEIRGVEKPDQVTHVKVALGPYAWDPSETRVLIKRGIGRRSSDLMWLRLSDGHVEPLLHSLPYWDFDLSPDGAYVAVTSPGKRKLEVFSVK